MAFLIVVPVIIIVSPVMERFVSSLFKEKAVFEKGKKKDTV
jgi:hypothetical protein